MSANESGNGNELSGMPTMLDLDGDLATAIRVLIRQEMRTLIGEAIAEYAQALRPDSVEIDEDSKGVAHPKVKVYANGALEAVTTALSAYRELKNQLS